MSIGWLKNSLEDGVRLRNLALGVPILRFLIVSFVVGSVVQVTIFKSFGFMTEVYFTDPPNSPTDESYATGFPIGHIAFFPVAAIAMLIGVGTFMRSISAKGALGILPLVFFIMGLFGISFYMFYSPLMALIVFLELEGGAVSVHTLFLLGAVHAAISYGLLFSTALIMFIERNIPGFWINDRIGLVWRATVFLIILSAVTGWQLIYWPIFIGQYGSS